jgi:hypothetical protein
MTTPDPVAGADELSAGERAILSELADLKKTLDPLVRLLPAFLPRLEAMAQGGGIFAALRKPAGR